MADWKRLTHVDGTKIDINTDVVAYMHPFNDHTEVFFVGGRNDEGRGLVVSVKEKPDDIHMAEPLRSM